MAYFTPDFLEFFKELAANNHKEWFHANKKRYEKEVKKPLYALVDDVVSRVQKYDPDLELEAKNAVFRINRDIRFSKDKTPYKTHVAAVVSKGGRKKLFEPGIYFHLEVEKSSIGGGCYQPDKTLLYNIRQQLVKDYEGAQKLLNEKKFKTTFGEIRGEKNKILPKEFKPHMESKPLILNKSFYFTAEYTDPGFVLQPKLADIIAEHYAIARPWNNWLKNAAN